MYAANQNDTGHIGIHGEVDERTSVRTYVWTVDDVMAIRTKISRIDGVPHFLDDSAPCAHAPLPPLLVTRTASFIFYDIF